MQRLAIRLRPCPDIIQTKPFRIAVSLIESCKLRYRRCKYPLNLGQKKPLLAQKSIRTKDSIRPEVFLSKNPNAGRIQYD